MAVSENLRKELAGKRALVVGGRGFIGGHIAMALHDAGAAVATLSLGSQGRGGQTGTLEALTGDIRDPESLEKCLKNRKFHYVVNSGGYIDHCPYFSGGRDLIDQHFAGTMNLLDLINGPDLLGYVHLGSSDEYGSLEAPQKETMREMPISPYSAAKVASTHLIQMLTGTEGFPGVVVRLFLVYGPGQDSRRFLPQVIEGCLKNRPFETSEGMQLRDFCYVTDVVEAILLAMVSNRAHGRVINVASGRPVTIREVIEHVSSMVGGGEAVFGKVPYRSKENMALYADINLARNILGWRPSISLEQGLSRTISWYRHEIEGRV